MAMICGEILKIPSMKSIEAVAGFNGMDRMVRWVYVAECFEDTRQIVDWLYGGELVIITGLGIKGNIETLCELIEKINSKNVSGLVINIGPYISDIPQSVIELADRLEMPLFKLPWKTKLVEITRDLCSTIIQRELEEKSLDNLLEMVLFGDSHFDENLIDRAAYYGYDLTGSCQVGIVDIDHFAAFLKQHDINDEKDIADIKANLKRIVQEVLIRNNKKGLLMLRSDSVIFLVKVSGEDRKNLDKIIGEVRSDVARKLHGLTISVGFGSPYSGLDELRKSFKEAEQALKVLKFSDEKNGACYYEEIGVYQLLLTIQERKVLERYYYNLLGTIIEHDRINSSELLSTLEMFLRESGNITTTAEKLFIHRNTLKYRIQKLEEITGCDLKDLQDRIKFEIGLMVGRVLHDLDNQ